MCGPGRARPVAVRCGQRAGGAARRRACAPHHTRGLLCLEPIAEPAAALRQTRHPSREGKPLAMAPPRNESSEGEPCATRHTCRAKAALLLTPIKPLIQSFCRCLPPEFHAGPGLHSAIVRDDVAALLATIQGTRWTSSNSCLRSAHNMSDS
eukprot:430392-Pleurochrysis_carterae.AAC.9